MTVIDKELRDIVEDFENHTTKCLELMKAVIDKSYEGSKLSDAVMTVSTMGEMNVLQGDIERFVDKFYFKQNNEKYFKEVTNE